MSATKTRKDLAARVAKALNLLRPGEVLQAKQESEILDTYDEALPELKDLKLAYWPPNEIPVAVFRNVAMLIALQVAPTFGMLPILLQALGYTDAEVAIHYFRGELARHMAKPSTGETLQIDYF